MALNTTAVFLGRRTLSKLYLLLHLGRMLQVGGSVRLETINSSVDERTLYDYCGLEICEYPTAEALMDGIRQERPNAEYSLVDVPDGMQIEDDGECFLVTDSDRVSVEHALEAVRSAGRLSGPFHVHRVFLDICDGSRISVRYLEEMITRKFPLNAQIGELFALGADERDRATMLENQHDDRLRLGTLGSGYRRLLAGLAETAFKVDLRESQRRMKQADRRKRA